MNSILLSIRPEHALNILNGTKTLELRKTIPHDFKGWVYVYVTKAKPYLGLDFINADDDNSGFCYSTFDSIDDFARLEYLLNGKVVARFLFDEYDGYENILINGSYTDGCGFVYKANKKYFRDDIFIDYICKNACITREELDKYFDKSGGYAWHIKKLEIFDKPMELKDFKRYTFINSPFDLRKLKDGETINKPHWEKIGEVTKAPQSWQYVEVKGETK